MRRVPTIEQFDRANKSLFYAFRWPTLWATREFVEDFPDSFAPWYLKAHYDFNIEVSVYALWFLVPFVKLWYWWMRYRWIIERNLRHRIFIVAEGEHCRHWKLAPLRKWGWKRDWRRMIVP